MAESILGILYAGLSLWKSLESRKYIDRLMSLKKDYYEEMSKPIEERSDAVLDDILFQLCLLGAGFSAAIAAENAQNKS